MKLECCAMLMFLLLGPGWMPAQQPKQTVDEFGWLAGCWGGAHNKKELTEQWMKPAGGTMLGAGRTVSNGKTVEYEFVQLRQDETGDIYYVARPSGQKEASFKLVRGGPREAVFEDPEHDFPQRIIYRLESDGSLLARIEGVVNGKEKGVNFPLKRVSCE